MGRLGLQFWYLKNQTCGACGGMQFSQLFLYCIILVGGLSDYWIGFVYVKIANPDCHRLIPDPLQDHTTNMYKCTTSTVLAP